MFPACRTCNNGTSDQDLLISVLARSCWTPNEGESEDVKMPGLISRAERRHPGLIKRMIRSPRQARQDNKRLGITPKPGETHQGLGVTLPEEFDGAMNVFAKKLAKGVFYMETNEIFPNDGTLLMHWFTNAQLKKNNRYPAIELIDKFGGKIPSVRNGNRLLNDQFSYRLNLSSEHGLFSLEASFSNAFGFVVFGCVAKGQLELIVKNLEASKGTTSPFQIIQSA